MGLLQKIFGKKQKVTREFVEKTPEELLAGKRARTAPDVSSFRQIDKEQEIVACCERIMEHTNTVKEDKAEYELVTGYLQDADVIDQIPLEDHLRIEQIVHRILLYTKDREDILAKKHEISDARMTQFDSFTESISDQLERLKSNEAYQTMVKRDMQKLEGEKHSWVVQLDTAKREQKIFHRILLGMFVLFFAWIVTVLMVSLFTRYDLEFVSVITSGVIGLLTFLIFLRMQQAQKNQKVAEASLNRSIVLLNQMKAKYVSITNAVDYAYDRFDVHNAYELEYLWEQYTIAKHEREEYAKADEKIEKENRLLLHELHNYNLQSPQFWVNHAIAILDPREMVEVRHRLVEQRQKIRGRMEKQIKAIREERDNLKLLVEGDNSLDPEILEILSAVNRFCNEFEPD